MSAASTSKGTVRAKRSAAVEAVSNISKATKAIREPIRVREEAPEVPPGARYIPVVVYMLSYSGSNLPLHERGMFSAFSLQCGPPVFTVLLHPIHNIYTLCILCWCLCRLYLRIRESGSRPLSRSVACASSSDNPSDNPCTDVQAPIEVPNESGSYNWILSRSTRISQWRTTFSWAWTIREQLALTRVALPHWALARPNRWEASHSTSLGGLARSLRRHRHLTL